MTVQKVMDKPPKHENYYSARSPKEGNEVYYNLGKLDCAMMQSFGLSISFPDFRLIASSIEYRIFIDVLSIDYRIWLHFPFFLQHIR